MACWHLSSRRRAFSERWWLVTGRSTRPRHLRHSIRSSSTSTVTSDRPDRSSPPSQPAAASRWESPLASCLVCGIGTGMRVFDALCLTAQANPPFDRESVASMYRHINTVLARADADSAGSGPIMYVVVAPRSCSVEGKAATVDKVRQNEHRRGTVEPFVLVIDLVSIIDWPRPPAARLTDDPSLSAALRAPQGAAGAEPALLHARLPASDLKAMGLPQRHLGDLPRQPAGQAVRRPLSYTALLPPLFALAFHKRSLMEFRPDRSAVELTWLALR